MMPLLLSLSALTLCLAAATLAYLASPHQQLRARRLPAVACLPATVCGVVGATLWCRTISFGAGIAAALSAVMLAWVALPYLAWWLRGASRHEARR